LNNYKIRSLLSKNNSARQFTILRKINPTWKLREEYKLNQDIDV